MTMLPEIRMERHVDKDCLTYRIDIPGLWLMQTRWPRVRLFMWLIILFWNAGTRKYLTK